MTIGYWLLAIGFCFLISSPIWDLLDLCRMGIKTKGSLWGAGMVLAFSDPIKLYFEVALRYLLIHQTDDRESFSA